VPHKQLVVVAAAGQLSVVGGPPQAAHLRAGGEVSGLVVGVRALGAGEVLAPAAALQNGGCVAGDTACGLKCFTGTSTAGRVDSTTTPLHTSPRCPPLTPYRTSDRCPASLATYGSWLRTSRSRMARSRLPVASVWWFHAMHPTRCLWPGSVRILRGAGVEWVDVSDGAG